MYRYVSNARQVNSGWREPQGFNRLTDMFEKQHKHDFERERALDDIKKQLDDAKSALKKVQKKLRAPRNEEDEEQEQEEDEESENAEDIVNEASAIIAKAKEFEENLHTETILGRIQAKTVLDGILFYVQIYFQTLEKFFDSTYKLVQQGVFHHLFQELRITWVFLKLKKSLINLLLPSKQNMIVNTNALKVNPIL